MLWLWRGSASNWRHPTRARDRRGACPRTRRGADSRAAGRQPRLAHGGQQAGPAAPDAASHGRLELPAAVNEERSLFARLAVFAGGWTLEAAEAVSAGDHIAAADVLDLLAALVNKSLVLAEGSSAGVQRYRILETLRRYVLETPVQGVSRHS